MTPLHRVKPGADCMEVTDWLINAAKCCEGQLFGRYEMLSTRGQITKCKVGAPWA